MALPAARGAREEAVAACRVAAYPLTGGTTLRRRLLVPSTLGPAQNASFRRTTLSFYIFRRGDGDTTTKR